MTLVARLPAALFVIALAATPAGAEPRTVTASAAHLVSSTRVDSSGDGAVQYRVPALAVTGSGALVACYDARNVSVADLPNNIDIACRRSLDGGETWLARQVVARHGESDVPALAYGVGDPSLTYDRDTGRLFLFHVGAPPGVGYATALPSDQPDDRSTLHPWYRYSDDDGATWSDTVDLTAQLKEPGMAGVFASSGKGLQLTDGTLVVPFLYRRDGVDVGAYAVSGDHGGTWRMTGALPGNVVDEHKVEQLPDGSLISYARSGAGVPYRRTATAPAVDGPWSVPVARSGLPDPGCNGDVLRVDPDPGSPRADWLLASNPESQTARTDLVVRLSRDGGRTWPWEYAVEPGTAGYSTMVRLPDGSFGVLFEHAAPDSLRFVRFGIDRFPD